MDCPFSLGYTPSGNGPKKESIPMHDSRGAALKVGDRVTIEAEVTDCQSTDNGYCNCSVKVVTPQQSNPPPMVPPSGIVLNTRMVSKVGLVVLFLLSFLLCNSADARGFRRGGFFRGSACSGGGCSSGQCGTAEAPTGNCPGGICPLPQAKAKAPAKAPEPPAAITAKEPAAAVLSVDTATGKAEAVVVRPMEPTKTEPALPAGS